MGGDHDVCHYVSSRSSFKASILCHLCSARFYQNPASALRVTYTISVLHLLYPQLSLDLICHMTQMCQNIQMSARK